MEKVFGTQTEKSIKAHMLTKDSPIFVAPYSLTDTLTARKRFTERKDYVDTAAYLKESGHRTKIYNLEQIKIALKSVDAVTAMEEGFVAYSQGRVVVPPIGELLFKNPPGESHIKYGNVIGDDYYVIKISSAFAENRKLDLPTLAGMMVVMKQKTGEIAAVLLDEGHLTSVRTGATGAVVAKYLAPKDVRCIGIVGAGLQARFQLEYLKSVVECRDVIVWGIKQDELDRFKLDMEPHGFRIRTTLDTHDVTQNCNLIVTATPAFKPVLFADQIQNGTHITAMGAGIAGKTELDSKILGMADIVVADSYDHSLLRGEIPYALQDGYLNKEDIVELGNVIVSEKLQRQSDDQITVADLTGVAIQDIQIAVAVYKELVREHVAAVSEGGFAERRVYV